MKHQISDEISRKQIVCPRCSKRMDYTSTVTKKRKLLLRLGFEKHKYICRYCLNNEEMPVSGSCRICGRESHWMFCAFCSPRFGEVISIGNFKIYYGRLYTINAVRDCFSGKQVIRWWVGTDALTLLTFPPGYILWRLRILLHRLKARLLEYIVDQHWVVRENLREKLLRFGIDAQKIHIVAPSPMLQQRITRRPNLLIYTPRVKRNKKFKKWVYGVDIIDQLKGQVTDVNWLTVDGSQNMDTIYPLIDGYIRPTRHDGLPRMIQECEINQIPYYWSKDGDPDIASIIEFIDKVKRERGTEC